MKRKCLSYRSFKKTWGNWWHGNRLSCSHGELPHRCYSLKDALGLDSLIRSRAVSVSVSVVWLGLRDLRHMLYKNVS